MVKAIGGEMRWRAGFGRELDARIAKLLDEGRFEPIAVDDGLVTPAQRVVELAPEAEMNVVRLRCRRSRVAEERGAEQVQQRPPVQGRPERAGRHRSRGHLGGGRHGVAPWPVLLLPMTIMVDTLDCD